MNLIYWLYVRISRILCPPQRVYFLLSMWGWEREARAAEVREEVRSQPGLRSPSQDRDLSMYEEERDGYWRRADAHMRDKFLPPRRFL